VVDLCHWCHNEPPNGVHHNRARANLLKQRAQIMLMREQGWTKEDFIREFGKNYLDDEQEGFVITMENRKKYRKEN